MSHKVDPNGPRPMEYYAGCEWDSLNEGKPVDMPGSSTNALPMDYHAREESLRYYRTRGKEGKSHRH